MKFNFTLICLLGSFLSFGHNGHFCADKKRDASSLAKGTIATPEEDHYDISHLKFNISLTNTGTTVSGDVTTTAKVMVGSMPLYAFELDPQITVDSCKINGQLVTVNSNGSVRTVNLTTPLVQNAVFTAQVFYHGQPSNGTGFFTRGLNHVALSSGTNIMYTLSDMYTADDWWPSKQSLADKIDSVDMWVTVPPAIKAGSNGLLKNITAMPGGAQRYEWKTNYPIEYYLISVAVAPYGDYSYYMHFSNSNDSMLIQNYIYDSLAYMTPARKAALDSTGLIVDHFSTLFGRYPFWKEKYGHCIAEPLGGGMEHQTMTTLGFSETNLIAHELGHQWWGDHVTYHSWQDVWLSEGFATYCEQLFREHFWGPAAAKVLRTQVFNVATAGTGSGTVYVDDTTDANRVFDSRLTYRKGAAVAHMLRYVAPSDAVYFQLLRNFQQQYANGLAVTDDLKNMAATLYGYNLDTFFNQWIYKEGYPTYGMKWYQAGDDVYLQVNQTSSRPASVAVFAMPFEVKLLSAAGDTTIKIYNDKNTQNYSLKWSKTMTGLVVDPDDHVLNKQGSITKDPILHISAEKLASISIYPNPAKEEWIIDNAPKGEYVLYDISGKKLWRSKGNGKLKIPAADLAPGSYLMNVTISGSAGKTFQLVKY